MRINFTNFLKNKPEETRKEKLQEMKKLLVEALKKENIHGHISCKYYADGIILVNIDGEYYNCFDCNRNKFFSGYVGD